jgi:hypothetical protein
MDGAEQLSNALRFQRDVNEDVIKQRLRWYGKPYNRITHEGVNMSCHMGRWEIGCSSGFQI